MPDIFRIAWGRQFWGITENNINLSIHPSINSYKRHKTCNLQSGLFRVEHMLWIRMMQQPIFCQIRSFFLPQKKQLKEDQSLQKLMPREKFKTIQYVSLLVHRSVWRRLGIGEIGKSAAFHASRWYTANAGLWIRKHLSVSPRPPNACPISTCSQYIDNCHFLIPCEL